MIHGVGNRGPGLWRAVEGSTGGKIDVTSRQAEGTTGCCGPGSWLSAAKLGSPAASFRLGDTVALQHRTWFCTVFVVSHQE